MSGFRDHFGSHAAAYARHRPNYPEALYHWLAERCPGHDLAWDCGTGNGQAAAGLARRFHTVIATDASPGQVAAATPHPRIRYIVASAGHCPLTGGSTDLVTVAQALHWFDRPMFFDEVARVLRPGGLLAVWTYALFRVDGSVDSVVREFHQRVVGAHWPAERAWVMTGYAGLRLPFPELVPPEFVMARTWDLEQTLAYVGTWSAVKRAESAGEMPLQWLREQLRPLWSGPRQIRWPLSLRVCRKPLPPRAAASGWEHASVRSEPGDGHRFTNKSSASWSSGSSGSTR